MATGSERAPSPAAAGGIRVSSTLDDGLELVDRIPIGATRNQKPVVAMSIGAGNDPDSMVPDLKGGDRLEVLAEIEVTVDLTAAELTANAKTGGKATGKPYDYAPEVTAQLLLSSSPAAASAGAKAIAIGSMVRKKVSHDLHHAVFVFNGAGDGAAVDIPAKGLPWSGRSYVNLILGASHTEAKPGQILIVGQNNFDGIPSTRMASIALLRRRPASQPDPSSKLTSTPAISQLPLALSNPRVVYSVPLTNLKANEQIRAQVLLEAKVSGSARGRLSTEVFLADSSTQTEPLGKGYAASISSGKGKVTRANGSNCLPGTPTRYRKAGAIRVAQTRRRSSTSMSSAFPGTRRRHRAQDQSRCFQAAG